MPQINTFDYGKAIGQGTQNALSTMQAQQGMNQLRQQKASREALQGAGGNYDQAANTLRKQGHAQAANTLTQQGQQQRAGEMEHQLNQMKLVQATAPMARDQRSWDKVRQRWIKWGAPEEALPEQFDPNFVRSVAGEAEKKLSGSDLVEVQGPEGQPIYAPADQAVGLSPYQEPEQQDTSPTNVLMPGGDRVRGRKVGGELQIMGDGGGWQPAPRGAQMVGTSITGTAAEVQPPSVRKDLNEMEANTRDFIATTSDALRMLEETPDINTFTARGASIINDIQQEAGAFARARGIKFDSSNLDPSKHKETFDQLGVESPRLRSMVISLAFQRALSNNPDGRISDPDFRYALKEIGGNASDPRAFSATLRDVANRSARTFRMNYETRMDETYQGDLGLGALEPQQQPGPTRQNAGEIEVDKETQRLLEKYQ